MTKLSIKADPSKKFFIEMLTRDISLIDGILDLIDNSVDSIIKDSNFNPMKGLFDSTASLEKYKISINFNSKSFTIIDNSIGVTKRDAENKVFKFGFEQADNKGAGLSVYGIGMKRSFLKIGKKISFQSRNNKETIDVKINVLGWLRRTKWDFSGDISNASRTTGTTIQVSDLYDNVKSNFKDPTFRKRLLDKINATYGIFLLNKLKIEVNNEKAVPIMPKIARTKKIKPSISSFTIDEVKVKIIAGITHEDSKSLNGWYIFCNGRLILGGDTTEKTGWGNTNLKLRQFHPSINRFVGFVYFESTKVSLLPWTTTKDGVNFNSRIYQHALGEMVKIAQPIVSYLTKLYRQEPRMESLRSMIKVTDEVPLNTLKIKQQSFVSPAFDDINAKKGKQRISYMVPLSDLKKIKKIIGNSNISNAEIGKKTFYYFIEYEA